MKIKVVKFGGTSLANFEQIRKCLEVIRADEDRRFIVVSAPGKRTEEDTKITDLLIDCHRTASRGRTIDSPFSIIRERFLEIAGKLQVGANLADELKEVGTRIQRGTSYDYTVSRGEYFTARIMAECLGFLFVEAADIIRFGEDGRFSSESYKLIERTLKADKPAVIPGFYGRTADGSVKAFTRGGSDITGAIVARGTKAQVYENWTDVSGLLQADPRIVDNPLPLDEVTYGEVRELAALGANVFHEEAIHPVRTTKIPINIRNINTPEKPGTLIVPRKKKKASGSIGVAGKTGLSAYRFYFAHLGEDLEMQQRLQGELIGLGWKIIYTCTHCDSLLAVMEPRENRNPQEIEIASLAKGLKLEGFSAFPPLSLVGAVGERLENENGLMASLTAKLVGEGLVPLFLAQGFPTPSFIIGLEEKDCPEAIRIIYAITSGLIVQ